MNHKIAQLIAERVAEGLQRKSLTTCSRWSCRYRIMGSPYPGEWTFTHHPWLRSMHDSEAYLNVGQKAAQVGFTETVLNIAFFNIDVKNNDCLYILPAKSPDASDFSASRFDPAVEMSPHLSHLFSDVKNVGHKRAGSASLYIRGSRSRSGLKSVPVSLIVMDEIDEMSQENVPLAMERASGQVEKSVWMVSTPTIENYGINRYYQSSTQNHFFFPCPSCNRYIEFTFPDSIIMVGDDPDDPAVTASQYICSVCKNILPHQSKPNFLANGKWVPSITSRDTVGWYVNQMYSCTVSPADFTRSHLRGLTNQADEQEFYNSKLGLPHATEGARITDSDIEACKSSYSNGTHASGLLTLGIDVGKFLHYTIVQWFPPTAYTDSTDLNVLSKGRLLKYGKVNHFEELDQLMIEWQIQFAVIDANPERRKAFEFACRFWGHVRICFYGRGIQGKQIHLSDAPEPAMTVDRTSWLDLSLGRFKSPHRSITLPYDVDLEFRDHLKAQVRVFVTEKDDTVVAKYLKGTNVSDHYAHSLNYAELALPMAFSIAKSSNIRNIY